jgi:YbbR domain-containing protein
LTETGKPLELTVDPSTVTVRVKAVALPPSKNVLLEPNWSGVPAVGYRIARVEIVPNQIRVLGEASVLEVLSSIQTSPIDVGGISEDKVVKVGIAFPRGVRSDTQQVEVHIHVESVPVG